MDGDGIPQAFCPLLWKANGGSFNANGTPRLPVLEQDYIRGNCTEPYDCDTCGFLQEELTLHPRWAWCCQPCVSRLKKRTAGRGDHLRLAGFYTDRFCQNPRCSTPGEERWLQLVLGDILKEDV